MHIPYPTLSIINCGCKVLMESVTIVHNSNFYISINNVSYRVRNQAFQWLVWIENLDLKNSAVTRHNDRSWKKIERATKQITSKIDTASKRNKVYWGWGITSSSACKNNLRSSLCWSSWCDAILFTNISNACRLISINSALKRNFSAITNQKWSPNRILDGTTLQVSIE